MSDTTKPPAINRKDDPQWGKYARQFIRRSSLDKWATIAQQACDFADAMLRERDRRDREERP